jgi:hypothetical protein
MNTPEHQDPWLPPGNDFDPRPRYVSATAGGWLFLSAFLWTHRPLQWANAWLVGALIFATAFAGMAIPKARFVNTLLALWLFTTAVFVPAATYTAWNNGVLAAIVFFASLIHKGPSRPFISRSVA